MAVTNHSSFAISEGIKAVGVGKKGSKALTPELIQAISRELKEGKVPAVIKGAFFGALIMKGVTPEEKALEAAIAPGIFEEPLRLVQWLAPDAPATVQGLCARLLQQETLDEKTAETLGDFLFSIQPGDGARGMAASVLRVRYETPEEYAGILKSIQKTIEPSFREEVPRGEPIVQIAEPFDGVDHSYLVTPLLARYLQERGYRVVALVGRNSGPKFGNNLLDLATALSAVFLTNTRELQGKKPALGWYVHQEDLSKTLDRWVELRRQIIKRPFLSTLERFVNPVHADILVASAFHPPYGEKMLTIAERAGYRGIVILRNGLEGTLVFPLKRGVKILCSVRHPDGNYRRSQIEFDPEQYLGISTELEEKLKQPSVKENARLVEGYARDGHTDNSLFDWRVRATCEGIRQGVEWIERNRQ